jgi:galactofuranosylgalactofuranosylrhamnosyl-N-acetylglucosaminyl-diphospho-decaprenol beta-1,5/1,6-galactofuranosyltransferase
VSLPGVAAWQAPWTDKNDAQDWQSYYHLRNRIVTALLHSQAPRGGSLVPELMERQLQTLLSMQYSTAALKLMAIEDVLSGPAHLHRDLGTKLKQIREVRTQFSDARDESDLGEFPAPRRRAPDALKDSTTPTNKYNLVKKAVQGTARQFKPVPKAHEERPQMALPYQDAAWFVMVKIDSVLVSTADGTSAAWYKRDPRLFRSLGLRSVILHRRLRRRWPRLAAEYRAAAADFTSPERWRETFAASLHDPGGAR